MKKLLITLLFLVSIAYAQNISITKVDIDRAFALPQGSKLFDNTVFSASDTLLVRRNNYITSRLSKFQGSLLSINLVNGIYVGRIIKNDIAYYELKPGTISGTYSFRKLDATNILSEMVVENTVAYKKFVNSGGSKASITNIPSIEELEKIVSQPTIEEIKEGAKWADNIPVEDEIGWACLFLDFDGQFVNSSMWNFGTPFYCEPVSFVNNQDSINYIVNRVKALYYPFRVTVTADSTKYFAAPLSQRMRIIVTPPAAGQSGGTTAIGYVTSFTWGDNTPSFVFYGPGRIQNLPQAAFSTTWIGGTTMGNFRQSKYDSVACTLQQAGSNGFGTGETSWAPIMGGTGWTRNVWTWGFGPTPNGCTFRQDNIQVLITQNGFGYRRTSTSPQNLTTQKMSRGLGSGDFAVMQPNFIPVGNDSASFKIDISKIGVTTITASPKSFGPSNFNATMKVGCRLYSESGTLVAQSAVNDASLSGVIQQTIAPGTYYLIVYKDELPQTTAPAFYLPRGGYGQYGFFSVTMD
jgi:hypothetical protein